MIKSMTGFGQAELKSARDYIRVEIKTINHKFSEISLRLPPHLMEFEEPARKAVVQEIRRGKVNVFVASPDPAVFSTRLVLNEQLAREVFHKIEKLKDLLKLRSAIGADVILREVLDYPGVLTKDTSSDHHALYSHDLMKALSLALASLNRSKILEGRALEKDLKVRLSEIKQSLRTIQKRIPVLAKEYKKSLESRMKDFLKNGEIDDERLALEVALYVKNSDISEEVTRLKSHLDAMAAALKESGELGRKLDFIAQEMIRETNTIGSKSNDVTIANCVIAIKSAIEKIREQAQNVE
jgi:uncharacterized protein (TIGR00255 family)